MEYFIAFPLGNCVYILYTKIAQDVYNWCIQNVYKMYNIFQQTFVYILYTTSKKTTPAKYCTQNVYKSLLTCGIHFVYKSLSKYGIHFVYKHFVYTLYTKCIQVCQNAEFILYTFCIHQFWST